MSPAPGVPAPLLCYRCRRALWWRRDPLIIDGGPVLVDVRGRALCRPLFRHGFNPHAMTREATS